MPGGRNSVAECQLPKLDVAGSNPVGRSNTSGAYGGHPVGPSDFLTARPVCPPLWSGGPFVADTIERPRRYRVAKKSSCSPLTAFAPTRTTITGPGTRTSGSTGTRRWCGIPSRGRSISSRPGKLPAMLTRAGYPTVAAALDEGLVAGKLPEVEASSFTLCSSEN